MPHTIPTDRSDIEWRNESTQKPPKQAVYIQEAGAAEILKNAHAQTATVWTGDFHNAKQVLSAMKKRIRRPSEKKREAYPPRRTSPRPPPEDGHRIAATLGPLPSCHSPSLSRAQSTRR